MLMFLGKEGENGKGREKVDVVDVVGFSRKRRLQLLDNEHLEMATQ
jgi:hypothetical protein